MAAISSPRGGQVSRPVIRWPLQLTFAALISCILSSCQTLPIYQLAPPNVSTTSPPIPIGNLLGPGAITVSETPDRVYFRAGPRRAEVYKASGGFWYEDTTRLWNPEIMPQNLPDSSQLRPAAMAISSHGGSKPLPYFADSSFTTFDF